ncbi:MAG: cytochrome c family protein [Actinomycetota bacterium]
MIRRPSAAVAATGLALLVAVAACRSGPSTEPPPEVPEGNPARGADLIQRFGCGSCHIVPGIPDADGLVGPPLIRFGSRQVIAGRLANNGDNLIRWVMDPQVVEPGTDMPDLRVTEQQARDIAAYLFTLK